MAIRPGQAEGQRFRPIILRQISPPPQVPLGMAAADYAGDTAPEALFGLETPKGFKKTPRPGGLELIQTAGDPETR